MRHRPPHIIFLFFLYLVLSIVPAQAQNRFIDNGDGTVTDRKSGLMWAKTDNQVDITWKQARQWARTKFPVSLTRKYDNWRLPTIKELTTLHEEGTEFDAFQTACGFAVTIVPQIQPSCTIIWSSETAMGSPLAFNFYIGTAFAIDITDSKGCRVLPVRNLK
ncbi:MAG: DUF1566 domain-containing protein [Deltaproteobacteria bacterium]|nr:DUF1566 domain-containing protein [Deltaproteobacteria bacterium]